MAGPARTVTLTFLGSTADLERALARAGVVAEESGHKIGDSFTKGTSQAGGAISKLSQTAASWGVPFAASLQTVGKHLDEATTKTARLHAAMSEAGKVTLVAGGAGFAAAAVEATKLGVSFETAQAKIQGATGQSAQSAQQLTKAFEATAGSSMQSGQAMEAAFAGVAGQLKLTEGHVLSVAESMKVMSAAENLTEATGQDLATTTGALASVMQAFHLSASQAATASDTLFNVSRGLNVPMEEITKAMERLHGRLGELMPGLGDVGGLMLDLAHHGVMGSRGVMTVNSALQTLVGGGKKTEDVLKALGVQIFDQNGKFIGLQNVIAQLQPKLAGLTQQQRIFAEQTLFGKNASQVMGQVIQEGVGAFQRNANAATQMGTAHRAATLQQKTLHGEMQTLKATVETLGGALGLFLIPKIEAVAKALANGIQWLEKHKAAMIAVASVVTGVLGTAVAIFAYDKAVAFVKGTERMLGGLKDLVTGSSAATAKIEADQAAQAAATEAAAAKIEAANTAEAATFQELGPAAVSGTAAVDAAVGTEAATVTATDTTIATENAVAGASFMKLLGPIGLVTAGLIALNEVMPAGSKIENLLGGNQPGEAGKEGEKFAKEHGYGGPTGHGYGPGGKPAIGGEQGVIVEEAAKRYGVSPQTLWGVYGTETSYGKNISTSSTGAMGAFQFEPETARQYHYPLTNRPGVGQFKEQAEAAAHYLSDLHHQLGSWSAALAAYSGHTAGYAQKVAQNAQGLEHHSAAVNKNIAALEEHTKATKGKVKTEPYVEPLEHATHGRTDMGLDLSAPAGSAIRAIGAGVIDKIIPNWFKGQPLIEEQLTAGSRKGQYVYYAEQINRMVQEGQHVAAGQLIGRVAPTGTGLELGFGAGGGRTLAQATTGYTEGQVTKAGQAFDKFIASIGKGGTVLSQAAMAAEAAGKAEEKRLVSLEAAGKKLLGEGPARGDYMTAIQSGSVPQLEKILGVSTAGKTGESLARILAEISQGGYPGGVVPHEFGPGAPTYRIQTALRESPGQLTQADLTSRIMPLLERSAAGTPRGKEFDAMVAELKATHQANLVTLAAHLVQAHRQALADLGRELYAAQKTAEGQALQNQATEEKDRTTQAANLAARQLQVVKDEAQAQSHAFTAAAQQIDDAANVMKAEMAAAAEAIKDTTAIMADAAAGQVQETQNRTQVQVATLEERGKYGLELIAQKLTVQLDQMKLSYDIQIQQAKMALDSAKAQQDALVAAKQQSVALLQAHEDALIATAQAHEDQVQITQDVLLAAAQSHVDTILLAGDIQKDLAQAAVVQAASGTKAQQDAAQGWLRWAQGNAERETSKAEAGLSVVQNSANATIQAAERGLTEAQGQGAEAMAHAQQVLAQAEAYRAIVIGNAEQALQAITGTAQIAEAGLEGEVAVTKAEAATQYAGSGLQVNITGIPMTDANAIASAVGWELRTKIPS